MIKNTNTTTAVPTQHASRLDLQVNKYKSDILLLFKTPIFLKKIEDSKKNKYNLEISRSPLMIPTKNSNLDQNFNSRLKKNFEKLKITFVKKGDSSGTSNIGISRTNNNNYKLQIKVKTFLFEIDSIRRQLAALGSSASNRLKTINNFKLNSLVRQRAVSDQRQALKKNSQFFFSMPFNKVIKHKKILLFNNKLNYLISNPIFNSNMYFFTQIPSAPSDKNLNIKLFKLYSKNLNKFYNKLRISIITLILNRGFKLLTDLNHQINLKKILLVADQQVAEIAKENKKASPTQDIRTNNNFFNFDSSQKAAQGETNNTIEKKDLQLISSILTNKNNINFLEALEFKLKKIHSNDLRKPASKMDIKLEQTIKGMLKQSKNLLNFNLNSSLFDDISKININNKIKNIYSYNYKNINNSTGEASGWSAAGFKKNENFVLGASRSTVINNLFQYVNLISKFNMERKGLIIKYQNILAYKFPAGRENSFNLFTRLGNCYNFLTSFFKTMYCFISKPIFILTPNKIIIRLFYYLCIPSPKFFKWLKANYKIKTNIKNKRLRSATPSVAAHHLNPADQLNLDNSCQMLSVNNNDNLLNSVGCAHQQEANFNKKLILNKVIGSSQNSRQEARIKSSAGGLTKKSSNKQMSAVVSPRQQARKNRFAKNSILKKSIRIFRGKSNFVMFKLIELNNKILTKIFSEKFKIILNLLSKYLKKSVVLDLTRLHQPYYDSNILVNFLAYIVRKKKINRTISKIFTKKNGVKKINDLNYNGANKKVATPAFLSGLNIKIAGRLLREPIIPRLTIKKFEKGASAPGKVNMLDIQRITKKNKKGAFSITITSGQNFKNLMP